MNSPFAQLQQKSPTAWLEDAACRDYDPELWFATSDTGDQKEAVSICNQCPVRQQCLQTAMEAEVKLSSHTRYGIFGGLTSKQRAALTKHHPKEKMA